MVFLLKYIMIKAESLRTVYSQKYTSIANSKTSGVNIDGATGALHRGPEGVRGPLREKKIIIGVCRGRPLVAPLIN